MADRRPSIYDDNYYGEDLKNFNSKKLKLLDGLPVAHGGILLSNSKCHAIVYDAIIDFSGYMYISNHGGNGIQFNIDEAKSAWIDWGNQMIHVQAKTCVLELHFYEMKKEDFENLIITLEE